MTCDLRGLESAAKKRQQVTHRTPSRDGRESISVAARVKAMYDIGEVREVDAVQQGIAGKPEVIKRRDYARHDLYIGGQLRARAWTIHIGRKDARVSNNLCLFSTTQCRW